MTGGVTVQAGATVAGVRLGQLVGRGSTGEVWAGTDLLDGTRVAIKLLSGTPAAVDAALAQGTRHPHVLEVRRVSHDPPAVVTVLAGGGSLAAQVQARGRLRPEEVVTVLAPLGDALAWLHARGVVHGDVSGTNVLFVERGRPVLGDLGSASLAGSGLPVATPGYAAPEVAGGGDPSAAADVHGLAAVAWLALTGSVPPVAEDRLPLRLLVPECPDELVDAVTAGLDPDPRRRPPPSDLAASARAAATAEPVGLVPSAALGVRADEAVTYRVRASAARQRPSAGRRPRRLPPGRVAVTAGSVGLTALVVAAGGVAVVPGWFHDPPGPGADVPVAGATGPVERGSPAPAVTEPVTLSGADLDREVRMLVATRQAALRRGDADLLARVHHPDGSTLDADRDLLRAGPVDVSYRVLAVEALGPSSPADDAAVEAAVRLTTTADGTPAVLEDVVVRVDRHDGRWLVSRVTD